MIEFETYLNESLDSNKEVDVDEYIKLLKQKGLFGYNVFKNISEEELKKVISDDDYFKSKMKSSDITTKDKEDLKESYIFEGAYSQSLADRLKLGNSKTNSNQPKTLPKKSTLANSISLADRLKAQRLQQQQDRIDKAKKAREELDNRLHGGSSNNASTFKNISMDDRQKEDDKNKNSFQQKLNLKNSNGSNQPSQQKEKPTLKDRLFKRANTQKDDNGYKRVNNPDDISDKSSEQKLQGRMNTVGREAKKRLPINEYSKRTLCAIGDRMSNFVVFCKFRKKTNKQIRTGNFKILPTTSQITNKQDTIVVQDMDLSKKENKVVYRSINLVGILQMKPL